MSAIFVTYRREDSAGHAGRIVERLRQTFGADHVFMDIQDIMPGEDFPQAIDARIAACNVVLCLIGPHWLSSLRTHGNGEDFVRFTGEFRNGEMHLVVLGESGVDKGIAWKASP